MVRKVIALAVALAGLAVAACGGVRGGSGGGVMALPQIDNDLALYAKVPEDTIGEELPSEGVGTIKSKKWVATLGGFTQTMYSQALGFPPKTKITIRNISTSITHTLDVVKVITKPPAIFPADPKLSVPPKGGTELKAGYASGPIKPGKSVTVTLVEPGIYLIGCAYHYHSGMRDVLVVEVHATPGPQATPAPKGTRTPTSRSSYDP
jgi:plastocyanin